MEISTRDLWTVLHGMGALEPASCSVAPLTRLA